MEPHPDLERLLEDLEQQADGFALAARDAELADRVQGEYAAVSFGSRMHASLGRAVVLVVSGTGTLRGVLTAAGRDWCTLSSDEADRPWLVRFDAVEQATGLSGRALPEEARPVTSRLGFGAALRRWTGVPAAVHMAGGGRRRVRFVRVGADFAEAVGEAQPPERLLVTFAAVAAVRPD